MRIQYFRYLFKNKFDVFYINEHIALYKKPYNITDDRTGASADFKSVDEMLKYKIDGLTIKDMILQLEHPYIPPLEGGRGAGGGDKTQSWGSAGNETGGDGSPYIPPAVANTKIKSKSLEGALAEFKRNHLLSNREYAYSVDEDGYVTGYNIGGEHSVYTPSHGKQAKGRTNMIIHNHPSGGAFSTADMYSVAADRGAKGIIASGKNYDYVLKKGTHFNAQGFTKAVKQAEKSGIKGKSVDDAVDKWLKKNQKKYCYTYSRTKN